MTFGLQEDGAAAEHFVAGFDQFLSIAIRFVQLRFFVFQHQFAIDKVSDSTVAVNLDFGGDPLVAMIGFGIGIGAVLFWSAPQKLIQFK